MPAELHPDIWQQIFSLLRRPLPRPTGKSKWANVHQADLAACMSISKLFNECASSILYSTVVTDNLPLLAYNVTEPSAVEGVKSKSLLLQLTRRLFIEYGPKEQRTYEELLRSRGRWKLIELNELSEPDMIKACQAEAEGIEQAVVMLRAYTRLKLRTLSVGAFLPSQSDTWIKSREETSPFNKLVHPIVYASTALAHLITDHPRADFCQHVVQGPLAFTLFVWCDDSPLPLRVTAHLASDEDNFALPVLFGGRSRIYFPTNRSDDIQERRDAGDIMLITLERQLKDREMMISQMPELAKCLPIIEFYLPPSMTNPVAFAEVRPSIEREIKRTVTNNKFPLARCKKDRWSYLKIEEAPKCAACDWSQEDI